jgi:uncharacterized protein (DUF924 family)
MSDHDWSTTTPDAVLAFWFPDDGHDASLETHRTFWTWRMRGGVDDPIRAQFADLAAAAARGELDHWAATPRGRLALVIALDQFSRSVWRGEPGAFAQDIRAARLVLEALDNGHYDALPHAWERAFCLIALCHCEGPDHLGRVRRSQGLAARLIEECPEHLRLSYRIVEDQNRLAAEVIDAFGRFPHRNAVLGRISTRAEEAYIAAGVFPHQRQVPRTAGEIEAMLARHDRAVPASKPHAQ